jgi:hypothetical protein
MYASLLPVIERVLGPEHPDTLTACGGLADWTGRAGDPAAARGMYASLLPVIERVPGPRAPPHPGHPRQPRLLGEASKTRPEVAKTTTDLILRPWCPAGPVVGGDAY